MAHQSFVVLFERHTDRHMKNRQVDKNRQTKCYMVFMDLNKVAVLWGFNQLITVRFLLITIDY